MEEYVRDEVIVAKFGWNDVLNKPFEELFQFGYLTNFGCVVYQQGCTNMEDSAAFKMTQIRKATSEEINTIPWGR